MQFKHIITLLLKFVSNHDVQASTHCAPVRSRIFGAEPAEKRVRNGGCGTIKI